MWFFVPCQIVEVRVLVIDIVDVIGPVSNRIGEKDCDGVRRHHFPQLVASFGVKVCGEVVVRILLSDNRYAEDT